jgi:hypothetical protein
MEFYARPFAIIWTRKNLGKATKMIASGMSRAAVARSFNADPSGLRSALWYSDFRIRSKLRRALEAELSEDEIEVAKTCGMSTYDYAYAKYELEQMRIKEEQAEKAA